jgi:hypothetical protein
VELAVAAEDVLMITDFEPHRRSVDDGLDTVHPTANSALFVMIVLIIGIALAGWYLLARAGTSSLMESSAPVHSVSPPNKGG